MKRALLIVLLLTGCNRSHGGGGGGSPAPPVPASLVAVPSDLGVIAPGAAIPTVAFTAYDGAGNVIALSGTLDWTLTNLDTAGIVTTGSQSFAGTPTATVALSPIAIAALYRVTGTINGTAISTNVPLAILTIQDAPGPFVAMKSGRVGNTYSDSVAFAVPGATFWMLATGAIPAGIVLDSATGGFSGAPTIAGTSTFTLYARAGAFATPVRCALSVFSAAETEWVAGQSFIPNGPATVTTTSDSFTFTNSFNATSYTTNLRIYHPTLASITSPAALLVFHRGRGFNYLDYDNILTRISRYGFICASVEDYQAFFSPAAPAPSTYYDSTRPDAGMLLASGAQEAALNRMVARSQTIGDAFENKIDADRLFVGGHSRGGGATHGSHTRALSLKIRGVIDCMFFDLRYFTETEPPATAPDYDIPTLFPRLPALSLVAENDNDLTYPIADQLIDRVQGPSTAVTIYGACHNYTGDINAAESGSAPYITRIVQQDIMVNFMVAFLRRWADLDLSVEGFLYGGEWMGSTAVGVNYHRGLSAPVLVDDFQNAGAATNLLGGANSFTGGSRVETSVYPSSFDNFGSLGMKHNILTFSATSSTYKTVLPNTNVSPTRRLLWRCGQTTATGYDWLTLNVRITDGSGATSTVTIFDAAAPSSAYLPDYTGAPRVYDRFVEVQVPLSAFGGVNLSSVASVEFLFTFSSTPTASQQFYMDQLRFE